MTRLATIHRKFVATMTALAFAAAVPGIANAVPISLTGSVDNVFSLSGINNSPFRVGQSVSGLFDVDLGPDHRSFDVADTAENPIGQLNRFSLTVGSVMFDLDSSDFVQFEGQLSESGDALSRIIFNSEYIDVGLDRTYTVSLRGSTDLPLQLEGGPLVSADITASVGAADVPEPSSMAIFGLAVFFLGSGLFLQRKRRGLPAAIAEN